MNYSAKQPANHPEADISINRNRVKKYKGKNIYLDDGVEFEIELTNNTQHT